MSIAPATPENAVLRPASISLSRLLAEMQALAQVLPAMPQSLMPARPMARARADQAVQGAEFDTLPV